MKALGVKGRQVGTLMAKQVEWQILNPSGSREECLEVLSRVCAELRDTQQGK